MGGKHSDGQKGGRAERTDYHAQEVFAQWYVYAGAGQQLCDRHARTDGNQRAGNGRSYQAVGEGENSPLTAMSVTMLHCYMQNTYAYREKIFFLKDTKKNNFPYRQKM